MNSKRSKLYLKPEPTLKDLQEYVVEMELERGFSHQNILQKCLMLGEEVGELFKAVRKKEKIKIDVKSTIGSVEEELADIIIFVLSIANRLDINIEQALRRKEEINKQREWR